MLTIVVGFSYLPITVAEPTPNDEAWTVTFNREFERRADKWSGAEYCINHLHHNGNAREFSRIESSKRQVECTVDKYNNAVCVNAFEGAPRVGSFDPAEASITTSEQFYYNGQKTDMFLVFKISVNEKRQPLSGTTEVHFVEFKDWPKDNIYRLGTVKPTCWVNYITTISSAHGPTGQLQDSEKALIQLGEMTKRSMSNPPK